MAEVVWIKPNGKEITTNDTDASIQYAVDNEWKRKEEKKKRGRPAKSE